MDPLEYFAFFKYVPTVEEYLKFSPSKEIPPRYRVIKQRVVSPFNKRFLSSTLRKEQISLKKLRRREGLLRLLGSLSVVQYLGISGTVSMLNATEKDDVDVFIITRRNSLFTARWILILITSLLGVRRTRGGLQIKDKLCFNLFFSEEDLKVPRSKQNLYVAHEIGQLRTIVDKDDTYAQFLASNNWIKKYFPNFKIPKSLKRSPGLRWGWGVELILKRFQLWLINRHRTTEIITATQLWFFPADFEKRLPQSLTNRVAKKLNSL